MRFYLEGSPEVTLAQAMVGLMNDGKDLVRIAGPVQDETLAGLIDGKVVRFWLELGVGIPPHVTPEMVKAFMARPDIQAKVNESLRLLQSVQYEAAVALNIDTIEMTSTVIDDYRRRLKKQAAK